MDMEGRPGCRVATGQARVWNWASADRSHQTWLEVNVELNFYNLGSGWVRQWVFCEESNKPTILRENVGRTQTYKLPCDMGANCWELGLRCQQKHILSLRLWSLEAAGLFMHMHVLHEKCKVSSEKHYFTLRMADYNKGTACRVGRKEKYCTNWQGASSPSRPGWPGSPFSPLIPRNPCL